MSGKGQACPCGGGIFSQCCGRYIEGGEAAPDAAALMRSRYSAYVLRNEQYLLQTWHARTRPVPPLTEDGVKWLGLEVKRHETAADSAIVEFVARYRADGRGHRLHEVSNFVREQGRWWYVDGSFPEKDK
ncbi:YchJ family protein [Lacisediminimonas profundi]|uniref:YchJ family protein n=1 Tax=Lacisediminimonas profundi TaxID=2603856 RepID=UPI00124BC66A|nr:YchJ family metal-binding protein [Lacisediminimonas profundi]